MSEMQAEEDASALKKIVKGPLEAQLQLQGLGSEWIPVAQLYLANGQLDPGPAGMPQSPPYRTGRKSKLPKTNRQRSSGTTEEKSCSQSKSTSQILTNRSRRVFVCCPVLFSKTASLFPTLSVNDFAADQDGYLGIIVLVNLGMMAAVAQITGHEADVTLPHAKLCWNAVG